MTPDDLARLHARAMQVPGPWSAQDFRQLTAQPGTFLVPSSCSKYAGGAGAEPPPGATPQAAQSPPGFALGRVVLDEAELLTLAVDPAHRRHGTGRTLLAGFEAKAAHRGATRAFLEVATTNTPALALYRSAGWQQTGLRKAYYKTPTARIDAIVMTKRLVSD